MGKFFKIRLYTATIVAISMFLSASPASGSDILLPDLGDASSGLISPRQEYELGQKWLRVYRSHVPTTSDPFLQSYVEEIIKKLSYYSDLDDKRLDVLVLENPTLNAFAVPGGIVGIHTGLFNHSDTEDQFSSVLAHELAHISQRHFARRISDQKDKSIPTMAALLASILIAASAGADAGIAALSATQAAAIDQQLRFSRQMEQEADRIGMETMVKSGKDPFAMPAMFENMLRASRFSRKPPEFLLTHPLTESRVSDSYLRAQKFSKRYYPESEEFRLAKVRSELLHEPNKQFAIKKYTNDIETNSYDQSASTYGLALALMQTGEYERAEKVLSPLLKKHPDNLYYVIAQAEIDAEREQFEKAIGRLEKKLAQYPNNHPLNIRLAEILMKASEYEKCEALLVKHSSRRPKDDYVWYLLAEVHGLAGNIFQVHMARAEYFLLNGLFDKAIIQLKNAKLLKKSDRHLTARIDLRLKEARKLREEAQI